MRITIAARSFLSRISSEQDMVIVTPFRYRVTHFYHDTPPQFAHCNCSFSLNFFLHATHHLQCHGAKKGVFLLLLASILVSGGERNKKLKSIKVPKKKS